MEDLEDGKDEGVDDVSMKHPCFDSLGIGRSMAMTEAGKCCQLSTAEQIQCVHVLTNDSMLLLDACVLTGTAHR